MSGEKRFWKEIQPQIKRMSHCDRIESHDTATGRPDLNMCLYRSGATWDIELKYFGTKGFNMRPSQKRWFKGRLRAGGNCAVFLKILDHYYFIPGDRAVTMKGDVRNLGYYRALADRMWIKDIDWDEFEDHLNAKKPGETKTRPYIPNARRDGGAGEDNGMG